MAVVEAVEVMTRSDPIDPGIGARDHLSAELGRMVDRSGMVSEWLSVCIGPAPTSGVWTTRDRMVADDAAGLRLLVDTMHRARPGIDPVLLWSTLHVAVAWSLAELNATFVASEQRLVRVNADAVGFGLRLEGDEPGVRGLWIRDVRLAVLPSDPLASLGDAWVDVVVDDAELIAMMASDLVELTGAIVDAVRRRVSIGRRGLWAALLDSLLHPFAARTASDAGPADQQRRVAAVIAACAGTPLSQRPTWVDLEHEGVPHTALRRTACCLAYRWPEELHGRRPDSCNRDWDRYCFACPLIPEAETIERARYWIEHR